MARPSFKIDPTRLRSLREESNLTQFQVAKKVHCLLEKKDDADEQVILNVYQRIERTGSTSKKTAHAIAQLFDVSVEILQGNATPEEPEAIISQIRRQLQEQRDSANNPALLEALKNHFAEYEQQLDEEDMLRDFAGDIARQIEATQIGHDSDEIERLVAVTGWSEVQLQELGTIDGHWLLLERSQVAYQTVLARGMSEVMYKIEDSFNNNHRNLHQGDTSITFVRSLPWMHIEITHPRHSRLNCKFSFVRCKPNANGFKWINPTWRDEYWLDSLKDWAFRNISFLTDFDGNHYPRDVYNLRFGIQEINHKKRTRRIAYSTGFLEELPEDVFKRFKAEGESHFIVIDWLASGVADSLAPHLRMLPPECWQIGTGNGQIFIHLDIPYRLMHAYKEQFYDISYSIKLVEEVTAGKYRAVPWPNSCVERVISKFKERLFTEYDNPVNSLQFNDLPYDVSDIDSSTEAK